MITRYHALLGSAHDGLVSAASRRDYAAAAAAVLTQDGQPERPTSSAERPSPSPNSPPRSATSSAPTSPTRTWSRYTSALTGAGLPPEMAAAVANADAGLARGSCSPPATTWTSHRPASDLGARSRPERRDQRGHGEHSGSGVDTHEMVLIHRATARVRPLDCSAPRPMTLRGPRSSARTPGRWCTSSTRTTPARTNCSFPCCASEPPSTRS